MELEALLVYRLFLPDGDWTLVWRGGFGRFVGLGGFLLSFAEVKSQREV